MAIHRISLPTPTQTEQDFQQIVRELLRHDPDRGLNVWGPSPDPVMLVWSPRIFEFLQVLESIMSYQPARGLCREVGFRSGHGGAVSSVEALGLDETHLIDVLLAMPRVLSGAGWGVSELEYDDARADVRWTFPKGTAVGVVARRAGPRTAPACAFFEGFGAGWVKGSVGVHLEFFERDCLGMGGSACRFESSPLG